MSGFLLFALNHVDRTRGAASGIADEDLVARPEHHEAGHLDAFHEDFGLKPGRQV